jgi:long-chain acyl-CoA synthetase
MSVGNYSDDAVSAVALPTAAGAVARLARQLERALGSWDLSLPQFRVLGILAEGTSAASSMAARLAVTPPSITTVVDGLVARGLIERGLDPSDRRRLPLVLTTDGRALLRAAEAAVADRLGAIAASDSDPQEATAAIEGLRRWHGALDAYRDAQTRDAPTRDVQTSGAGT